MNFNTELNNLVTILLSEVWLSRTCNVYIKVFDVIRKDRVHRAGGDTAFFISNHLKYEIQLAVCDCDGHTE
jgi:hypothetical protein